MIAKHKGVVEKGKFTPYSPEAFYQEFYKREGKEIFVTVEPVTKKKSNNQNRYYRGVLLPILAEELFGSRDQISCDQMHSALGQLFLMEEDDRTGLSYIKSTSNKNWSTVDWEEYIEQVRRWASMEHAIYIPEPNEVKW